MQTPDGPMNAGVILINCSLDLPARAIVLNTKQWNGAFGCLYCEDQGTVLDGDHLHRYWPQQGDSVARSHSSLLLHAEEATRTKTAVCVNVTISVLYTVGK